MIPVSFGSDPEFLLVDLDGNYRSAIDVIPGTKEDKVNLGNGHFAFYDNVLAEVNISPGNSAKECIEKFRDCFQRLVKLVGTNLRLKVQASQIYPRNECQHPDAKVFGCDPEYNIYLRNEEGRVMRVDPPVADKNNTFRSAGGHIHIGHELALPWHNPIAVIQMMDILVGLPAVLMDNDPTSLARRKLYGGAGTHRLCLEYGVEYRSLSNFWVSSPELVETMYNLSNLVIQLIGENEHEKVFQSLNLEQIPIAINNNKKLEARKLLEQVNKYIPKEILKKIEQLSKNKTIDFYKSWRIK